MASEERDTRNKLIGQINQQYNEKRLREKSKYQKKRDKAQAKMDVLKDRKIGASLSKKAEIEQAQLDLDSDIFQLNKEEASLMRMLELERRDKIANVGTSYVPAFDGIVQAVYRGLDASGNHYAAYGGKSYKAISMGATSIRKGTLVQLWFSGNSYYIDW